MEEITDLIPLAFESKLIRCLTISSHPTELVAVDVCAALRLAEFDRILALLAPNEQVNRTAIVLGGKQQLVTVTAAGLDKLLGYCRPTLAKRFRRWWRRQVLPAIPERDHPSIHTEIEPRLTAPEYTNSSELVAATQQIKQLREQLEIAQLSATENHKALLDANERALWSERMSLLKSRQLSQHQTTITQLTSQIKHHQQELKQCQDFILQAAQVLGAKAMEIYQDEADK